MPSLKQLTCHVEWASSSVPFKEYGTAYGDGIVESYIAIPNHPTPFSISLESHGYISSGLAMFVFADGVYQCNRNRDDLQYPKNPSNPDENDRKKAEVNFRVRQREENRGEEVWAGRPWRFEPLNLVEPNSTQSPSDSASHFKYLGTIQVAVLRCVTQPGDISPTWGENGPSRSLSPESATAPVLDFEESGSLNEPQNKDIEPVNTFWAVYDGPSDNWPPENRENNRPYTNGYHKGRKPNGLTQRPVNRDQDWGGSQVSYRSSNPSVVVNVHTNVPRDANSDWDHRPISPRSQLINGCYNIQNGKRVHGSQDWRQERSPSVNSQRWGEDNQTNGGDWDQRNGDQHLQQQDNGGGDDYWGNGHENNQETTDDWVNGHNDDNPPGNWGNDTWEANGEQNNQTGTDDWVNNDNDQNNFDNTNVNDTWGSNPQDSNQTDADGWTHVNGDQTNADNSGGDNDNNAYDSWANDGNDQNTGETSADHWGSHNDNNGNGAGQNDNSNQQPSNGWGEDYNQTNNPVWGSSKSHKATSAGRPRTSSIPPVHPQAYQYRPPSSHGDFPNRSGGTNPPFLVTPRLVQQPRNDEPLLYTVPVDVAKEKLTTHQVQPGASAPYTHKISTPDYLDTIEKPYAMFVFKYRQKEVIEQTLGITIERDVDAEKKKLEALPRDVIIDQLLRAQGILGDHIPPPTHSEQNGKQKWRAEFPLPNNYTTAPIVQRTTGVHFTAHQPPASTNAPPPPPDTTTFVNETSWGAPEPTPSAYNQTPAANGPPPAPVPPIISPVVGSPTGGGWGGQQPPHEFPADKFNAILNAKLQTEADKRSTTSKDSWATRSSGDMRKRGQPSSLVSGGSNGSRRNNGGGSQTNVPTSWGAIHRPSQERERQASTSQGGIVAGEWQTYQPSNPNPGWGQANDNNSNKSGSNKGQGGSGNGAAAAAEPTVPDDAW